MKYLILIVAFILIGCGAKNIPEAESYTETTDPETNNLSSWVETDDSQQAMQRVKKIISENGGSISTDRPDVIGGITSNGNAFGIAPSDEKKVYLTVICSAENTHLAQQDFEMLRRYLMQSSEPLKF